MYLRITRGRFDPTAYEQVASVSQEISAAMRRLPGLQHHHLGIDRTAGTVAAVSVWDSAEHARFARETLGAPLERGMALGVQLDPPEIYEIDEESGS